ncbi:ANTAR domain-containing protein [Rhodococcus aerolatus]
MRDLFHDALAGVGPPTPQLLCDACLTTLGVDRAAIVIVTAPAAGPDAGPDSGPATGAGASVAATTDDVVARVEEQQVTAGVGPAVEAHERGGPVLVADLARDVPARWPALSAAAELGGSLCSLPLQLGAIRLGVLDLYRDSREPLDRLAFADAVEAAEMVTTTLLLATAEHVDGVPQDPARAVWPHGVDDDHEVHQATGVVLVQLDCSAAQAYVRLRARAYAEGRPLGDLARDVVAHRVRFRPDTPPDPTPPDPTPPDPTPPDPTPPDQTPPAPTPETT